MGLKRESLRRSPRPLESFTALAHDDPHDTEGSDAISLPPSKGGTETFCVTSTQRGTAASVGAMALHPEKDRPTGHRDGGEGDSTDCRRGLAATRSTPSGSGNTLSRRSPPRAAPLRETWLQPLARGRHPVQTATPWSLPAVPRASGLQFLTSGGGPLATGSPWRLRTKK